MGMAEVSSFRPGLYWPTYRDSTLDAVAQHCAEQLDKYSACVTANPGSWETACLELQGKLAECSEKQYVSNSCLAVSMIPRYRRQGGCR